MTREEAITVLENEVKCVLRDSCERSECASCDLVMPVEKILSAYDMAISALQEQDERENPKPLTLDELRGMDGEPVWLLPDRKCFIVNNDFLLPYGERHPCGVDMWGAGTSLSLLAKCGVYRYLPKEDAK